MMIRRYAHRPAIYVPDIGEVVLARLCAGDTFTRAVITYVIRRRNGSVRLNFMWLDTNERSAAVAGTYSHVYVRKDWPLRIKQINKGQPGAS